MLVESNLNKGYDMSIRGYDRSMKITGQLFFDNINQTDKEKTYFKDHFLKWAQEKLPLKESPYSYTLHFSREPGDLYVSCYMTLVNNRGIKCQELIVDKGPKRAFLGCISNLEARKYQNFIVKPEVHTQPTMDYGL